MLLECSCSYLQSVKKKIRMFNFGCLSSGRSIFDVGKGGKGPWLFFEARKGPRAKRFGQHFASLYPQQMLRPTQLSVHWCWGSVSMESGSTART